MASRCLSDARVPRLSRGTGESHRGERSTARSGPGCVKQPRSSGRSHHSVKTRAPELHQIPTALPGATGAPGSGGAPRAPSGTPAWHKRCPSVRVGQKGNGGVGGWMVHKRGHLGPNEGEVGEISGGNTAKYSRDLTLLWT